MERRIKRLELICLEDAKSKIASLRDGEAGTIEKDGRLSIEEIVAREFSPIEGNGRHFCKEKAGEEVEQIWKR